MMTALVILAFLIGFMLGYLVGRAWFAQAITRELEAARP